MIYSKIYQRTRYADSLADTYFNEKRLHFVCHSVILLHSMFFPSSSANAREFASGKVPNMADTRTCLLKTYMFIVLIWIFLKLEVFSFIQMKKYKLYLGNYLVKTSYQLHRHKPAF